MNKTEAKNFLSTLFVPRDHALKGVAFRSEYMKEGSEAYRIYDIVSQAQHESGMTFDFSYVIAKSVCDILSNLDDWDDDDDLGDAVDAEVPVYSSELMEIFESNSWAVDEAIEEYGKGADVEKDASAAWYSLIRTMVIVIRDGLQEIISKEK